MTEFKPYQRRQVAELRVVNQNDISCFDTTGSIRFMENPTKGNQGVFIVSISEEDKKNGSPKIGDMIARNPKNYLDQWLVAQDYFLDNFEPIK